MYSSYLEEWVQQLVADDNSGMHCNKICRTIFSGGVSVLLPGDVGTVRQRNECTKVVTVAQYVRDNEKLYG